MSGLVPVCIIYYRSLVPRLSANCVGEEKRDTGYSRFYELLISVMVDFGHLDLYTVDTGV